MRVVILAGGRGTRLAEETVVKPKPLVEIGARPILWHIMHIPRAQRGSTWTTTSAISGKRERRVSSTR